MIDSGGSTESSGSESASVYWTFISYSHADEAWGRWLHRSLEKYRVPRAIAGREGPWGKTPRRLFPVFRDRDELPSSSSLTAELEQALAASRTLVVICSPKAAVSRWVDEEIKHFLALGRDHLVFCFIADGEPNVAGRANEGLLECLPASLRSKADQTTDLDWHAAVPAGADVRPGHDGKRSALLKLVAAILDVKYDDLKQRERSRRRRRVGLWTLVIAVMLSGLGLSLLEQQRARVDSIRSARNTEAQRIASAATAQLPQNPQRSLLLASAAVKLSLDAGDPPPAAAEQALRDALAQSGGVPLVAHTDKIPIDGVRFSKDGRTLVTGSMDGTAAVWGIAGTGPPQLRARLRHGNAVRTVAISPDGKLAVTAGVEGDVRVWNLEEQDPSRLYRVLPGDLGSVFIAEFTPDGHWLVTVSGTAYDMPDPTAVVRLWQRGPYGFEYRPVELTFSNAVTSIAISADSRRLATAEAWGPGIRTAEGRLTLWNLDGDNPGARVTVLPEREPVMSVTFVGQGDRSELLAATAFGSIRAWPVSTPDVANAGPSREFEFAPGHSEGAVFMDASHDGHWVVAATQNGTAAAWDLREPGASATYPLSSDDRAIFGITVSPAGDWVAVGGDAPRLWPIKESSGPARAPIYLRGHEKVDGSGAGVWAIEVSADGRLLVTAGADAIPRIWNLQQAEFNGLARFILPRGKTTAAVSRDLRWAVTRGRPNLIWFTDETGNLNPPVPITGHDNWINEFVFNHDNRWLVTAGKDGTARLWSLGDAGEVELDRVLDKHSYEVYAAAFSPDGRWVATGGGDGKVLLTALQESGPDPPSIALEPGGTVKSLFGGRSRSGRPLNAITLLRFSDDGHWLAAALANGAISVWDVSTDSPRQDPQILEFHIDKLVKKLHSGELTALEFSSDNEKLISAGMDKMAAVWDLTAADPSSSVAVLPGHTGWIHSVAVSPNNRWVVTGGGHVVDAQGRDTSDSDSRVIVWDLLNPDATAWQLRGHEGWIRGIKFNREGDKLATLGDDGIRIWTFDGNVPETPIFIAGSATSLFFASDDRSLVAVTDRVSVYDLNVAALLDRARQIVGRDITAAEWQEYFPGEPFRSVFKSADTSMGVAPGGLGSQPSGALLDSGGLQWGGNSLNLIVDAREGIITSFQRRANARISRLNEFSSSSKTLMHSTKLHMATPSHFFTDLRS